MVLSRHPRFFRRSAQRNYLFWPPSRAIYYNDDIIILIRRPSRRIFYPTRRPSTVSKPRPTHPGSARWTPIYKSVKPRKSARTRTITRPNATRRAPVSRRYYIILYTLSSARRRSHYIVYDHHVVISYDGRGAFSHCRVSLVPRCPSHAVLRYKRRRSRPKPHIFKNDVMQLYYIF